MNRSTWAALVAALMLGSGIAGYLIGSPADTVDRAPPTRTAQTTPTATPATAPAAPRPAATPAAQPTPPRPVPVEPFRYSRLSLDNSSAEAEACLYFNRPLAAEKVKYADYLRITPEVKSAVRVVDDKLCIGGLAYGQDYAVTLLAGLPSASDGKLEDERKVSLALGPRPAAITLPGKGFILPRGTAAGLPITTVNVGKLGISVYRVNERGLNQFSGDRYYGTTNFPSTEPVTESWSLRGWLTGQNGKRIWRGS